MRVLILVDENERVAEDGRLLADLEEQVAEIIGLQEITHAVLRGLVIADHLRRNAVAVAHEGVRHVLREVDRQAVCLMISE